MVYLAFSPSFLPCNFSFPLSPSLNIEVSKSRKKIINFTKSCRKICTYKIFVVILQRHLKMTADTDSLKKR